MRNIYVAEGPAFQARRLTAYQHDDGQELTNLSFAPTARRSVYVRGGDHGSNWRAEGNLQPNPGAQRRAAADAGLVDRHERRRRADAAR